LLTVNFFLGHPSPLAMESTCEDDGTVFSSRQPPCQLRAENTVDKHYPERHVATEYD